MFLIPCFEEVYINIRNQSGCLCEMSFSKTSDGFIASTLKIEQQMGACHHLSNCFDNPSRSYEYNGIQ